MNTFGLEVGGYVLAGGKSSRMGQDKALLELAGKPLALHAVTKLRRVCDDVHILSGRHELAEFAPLERDLHAGCGPLGGIEAALSHSQHEWNLFMPVDMPFCPTSFLQLWVLNVSAMGKARGTRVAMFTVFGQPQPLLCLLHKEVAPFVSRAVERGEYKVFPLLEMAAKELAERQGLPLCAVFSNEPWREQSSLSGIIEGEGAAEVEEWRIPTAAQQAAKHLWFANLNTPEEFAEAKKHLDALDT
jgi:molybdopterin-guanine dinucleotide biosynthesis protein A